MAGKTTVQNRKKRFLTPGEAFFVSVLSGLGVMSLLAVILYFVAVRIQYAMNANLSLNVLASPNQPEESEEIAPQPPLPKPSPPPPPPVLPPPVVPPPVLATTAAIPTQTLVQLNQEMLERLDDLVEESLPPTEVTEPQPPQKEDPLVENYLKRRDEARAASDKKKKAEAKRAALALKLASPPVITQRITPPYPESARRAGHEGRVIIKVMVTAQGTASDPQIIASSGHRALDETARTAAKRFRFRPAKNGLGQSVPAPKDLPFTFQLREE